VRDRIETTPGHGKGGSRQMRPSFSFFMVGESQKESAVKGWLGKRGLFRGSSIPADHEREKKELDVVKPRSAMAKGGHLVGNGGGGGICPSSSPTRSLIAKNERDREFLTSNNTKEPQDF